MSFNKELIDLQVLIYRSMDIIETEKLQIMKEWIPVVISFMSFIVIGVFVYWRENRKLFQEKLFEYKYLAYKEISEDVGMFLQDVYRFLEYFQEYEGDEEKWNEDSLPYFKEFYGKAFLLEKLAYKHLILLPIDQIKRLQQLTSRCVSHVTVHSHIGTAMPHESYEDIENLLYIFMEEGRKDLNIDGINASLSKRLHYHFYPININLPRPKANANDSSHSSENEMND